VAAGTSAVAAGVAAGDNATAGVAAGGTAARGAVAGGAVAGGIANRPGADGTTGPAGSPVGWSALLGSALLAGPVAGGVLALAAWASAGPLGGGHLADVGPRPWPLAGIAAGLIGVGAVVAAAATKAMVGVRRRAA
jgi:hypothetical protein